MMFFATSTDQLLEAAIVRALGFVLGLFGRLSLLFDQQKGNYRVRPNFYGRCRHVKAEDRGFDMCLKEV
jgi:hypothetical protein